MSRKTHGLSHTRTNHIWRQMRYRCDNPKDHQYHNYGGRGIKVCERWGSFETFLEDMGEAPNGLTIERRDVDGNYCKENCYWAPWEVQANNRSTNRPITAFGITLNIVQWSKKTGIPLSTIKNRLDRAGMTAEEALTPGKLSNKNKTLPGHRKLRSDAQMIILSTGESGTRKELCKNYSLPMSTVTSRMKAGMTFEEALTTSLPRGIHKNRRK
jgi:hypothetical protein